MELSSSSEAQQATVDATPAPGRTTIIKLDRVSLRAVTRLLGGLRGWIGEEIQTIRIAQMDEAFLATTKGVQYHPTIVKADDRPSTF